MGALYVIVGVVLVLGVMVWCTNGDISSFRAAVRRTRGCFFHWVRSASLRMEERANGLSRVSALPLGGYVRVMARQDLSEVDSGGDKSRRRSAARRVDEQAAMAASADLFRGADGKPHLADISPGGTLLHLRACHIQPSIYGSAPVHVTGLPANSDFADSPLKPGDTVLSINGTATPTWEQAFVALKQAVPGATLKLEVEDGGTRRTVGLPIKDKTDPSRIFGYMPIRPIIDQVAQGAPADRAGLQEGDLITAVNGNHIDFWEQFQQLTRSSNGQPMTLDLTRKGQPVHLVVTPERGAAGTGENVYQIGIGPREETAYKRVSFTESVKIAGLETKDTIAQTVDVVGKLFSGRVSIKQLQGPVGISHMAGQAVRKGPPYVITLMVVISINLGILNLLPIPILDGGIFLLLAIEEILCSAA